MRKGGTFSENSDNENRGKKYMKSVIYYNLKRTVLLMINMYRENEV